MEPARRIGERVDLGGVVISLFVPGKAEPQGSKTLMRNGKMLNGGSADADRRLRAWRAKVSAEACKHVPIAGPVKITMRFVFERPKTHMKQDRSLRKGKPFYYQRTPDRDKLERAVNDSLTAAGLIDDDARSPVGDIMKAYSDTVETIASRPPRQRQWLFEHFGYGVRASWSMDPPGVRVTVEAMP